MEKVRLNKFISNNLSYSRRQADDFIRRCMVLVDGRIVSDPSLRVSFENSIKVKGKLLVKRKGVEAIIYNKPRGEIVSRKDEKLRNVVYNSLPKKFRNFTYVGRLDFTSRGLLVLSNSSSFVHNLSTSDIERVYVVKIDGFLNSSVINCMKTGINIKNSLRGANKKSKMRNIKINAFSRYKILENKKKYSKVKLSLNEGRNREIRRFFAHFGFSIFDLKRVNFGVLELASLPTKSFRYVNKVELLWLQKNIGEKLNRKYSNES